MTEATIDIQIPGYQILRELGRGGMASVYLAIQESMEREVALKIMLPSLAATDPSFSERFIREAKIIAKLSHPNVNAVFDVGVAGPYHYFSMEYITGGGLPPRIRNGMSPKDALAITRQIASALAFAHAKGYVHRDVKSENVLFRENGTAVLTDFGIAKVNDGASQMTTTGTVMGTPHFMSPEQAMGRAIDGRSDIYSLGIMVFHMLTGRVPYTGDSAVSIALKHVTDPLPQLPPLLLIYQPLLEKFLAKDPAHRFQTGEQAMEAIDAFVTGPHTTVVTKPAATQRTVVLGAGAIPAPTVVAPAKRRSGVLWVGAVLVPLLAGAVYFAWRAPAVPVPTVRAPAPAPVATTPVSSEAELAALDVQIKKALVAADRAARAGQYFAPADTAAVYKYRRVLELVPDNTHARRALNDIAGQFIAHAERAIEKGKFDQAETLLKQAEEADPSHPMLFSRQLALTDLRQKQMASVATVRVQPKAEAAPKPLSVESTPAAPVLPVAKEAPKPMVASVEDLQAKERREREYRLQGLVSRFHDLLTPSSLSATRAGLAQELLGEAMRMAPNDERVRVLTGQLADAYLKLAIGKVEQREYPDAETLIGRGLELSPDHRALSKLQKEVSEQKKKSAKRQTFGSF
ncbi:MAG: protein kinase [Gammaproteobacteria bacterium]|nr:protein kinase [Gammaproteobacteria bacterium]